MVSLSVTRMPSMNSDVLPKFGQQIADLWTAAMNNDRINADQFHQNDVLGKTVFKFFVDHGVAAEFDDNGFIFKFLNIRQGFNQNMGDLVGVCFL